MFTPIESRPRVGVTAGVPARAAVGGSRTERASGARGALDSEMRLFGFQLGALRVRVREHASAMADGLEGAERELYMRYKSLSAAALPEADLKAALAAERRDAEGVIAHGWQTPDQQARARRKAAMLEDDYEALFGERRPSSMIDPADVWG